jgi:hypothetical protein
MISTLIAAAALSTATNCPSLNKDDHLIQRISLPGEGRTLTASSYTHPGLGPGNIEATRLLVHSPRCELLFEQEFEGTTEVKLTTLSLDNTPFLIASTLSPGGSGCGISHLLLSYDGSPVPLAPSNLGHDNMGGLYVGDLGPGKGQGLILFEALWEGGSHYDPHPYRVWTYRWESQHFAGPAVVRTKPMTPDPKQVAKTLGFTISNDLSFNC